MSHDKDKILLRAKDISLFIMILTLFGLIMGPMKKLFKLESVIEDVEKMKPLVISHDTKIAINDERWAQVQRELQSINRKLDRGRRLDHRTDGE